MIWYSSRGSPQYGAEAVVTAMASEIATMIEIILALCHTGDAASMQPPRVSMFISTGAEPIITEVPMFAELTLGALSFYAATRAARSLFQRRGLNSSWRPIVEPGSDRERLFATLLPWGPGLAERFGLHPAVLFAQAALETGNGRSQTMVRNNAYWGVKASTESVSTASARAARIARESGLPIRPFSAERWSTHEVRDGHTVQEAAGFRIYPDLLSGAADYADLVTRTRYEATRETGDPYKQLGVIWGRGYATSERYMESVSGLIESITGTRKPSWIPEFTERILADRASRRDTESTVNWMLDL